MPSVDTPCDLQTNAALLIFEIGNSHLSVASHVSGSFRTNERFDRRDVKKAVDHARGLWDAMPEDRLKAIVAASVVPQTLAELAAELARHIETPLMVVGRDLHRPLSLAVEQPERVGIDRVCAAAAAYDVLRRACCVASFGTAITVDCINEEGVFMGGAILPGLRLQARALHEGTAALPLIELQPAKDVYGATTEQAILHGVLYGVAGALREITERYATDLHAWPQLVATGGDAALVAAHCDFIDNVVPDLCLRGIALAYRRHFADFDD
jgi:type III pantothenate kinase